MLVDLLELFPYLGALFAHPVQSTVVEVAVVEHLLHIVNEGLHAEVVIAGQSLLNQREVKRILHDLVVVGQVLRLRVDWVKENTRLRQAGQC